MSDYEPAVGVYESEEGDFCAARDETEALLLWAKSTGEDPADYDASDWMRLPDDKVLGVVNDDGTEPELKTCAEWAAGGPRYLFSRDH
jgi:hypothetical protein